MFNNSKKFFCLVFILTVLCSFCILLSSCGKNTDDGNSDSSEADTSAIDVNNMYFKLNDDKQSYTFASFHQTTEEDVLTIPAEYNGLPVTRVGSLTDGMGKLNFKKIILPDTIEVIGEQAFMNSTSLESIELGSGLKIIEYGAFDNCHNLTKINIPSSVTYLGNRTFQGCSSLNKVVLSNNLETIFSDTFIECPSLETLEMPNSNTKFICKNNCLINKNTKTLLWGCKSSVIPQDENIEYIASNAFAGCSDLTDIIFPSTLRAIGNSAFSDCTSLVNIIIPNTVQSIEENAFSGCSSLSSVIIDKSSNLKHIGSYAFNGCTSLVNVTIPNSVSKIGENVFRDCSALKGVEYESAVYLGNQENPYLFLLCTANENIASCKVHERTRFISSFAFVNCKALETVKLPEGLLGIGGYAFAGCPIKEFKLPTTINYLGRMPFSIGIDGEKVKDPDYTVLTKYDNAYYVGSEQNPYMVLVKAINTEITSCKINADTKIIYDFAFGECPQLEHVSFESNINLKSIGERAFSGCSLTALNIPDSVESIGWYAFDGCNLLTKTENGVIYVDNWVVGTNIMQSDGAQEKIHFVIKEGTIGIANNVFHVMHLSSIVLPKTIEFIGENCFSAISVDKVYYADCKCKYDSLNVGFNNSGLINTQLFYYIEQQPCYWHFVDGVPTEWE